MHTRIRSGLMRALGGFVFCGSLPLLPAEDGGHLRVDGGASHVFLSLDRAGDGEVHQLEGSADLVSWRELAFSNAPFARYRLPPDDGAAFYRVRSRPVDEASDWTNQLGVLDDRIFTGAGGLPNNPPYAKFTARLDEPDRVYFQDSGRYPFHYDFVRARLPGYQDIGYQDYARISLHLEGQELLVGTVIRPPDPDLTELGIQFTGNEPFPIEDVARWFGHVRSRIRAPDGWRFFYLPAYEQSATAFANQAWFTERGIQVDSATRWITENACYSAGWALGRLKFFSAGDIDAAFGDGRLTDRDILVTDQVPAEIPLVAGVLTLTPATPNSHVAIQAKGFRIPFAHPSGRALQDQILSMDGREVLLVVSVRDAQCEVRVQDVEGRLTPGEREAILDSKQAPDVEIVPMAPAGTYHLECAGLTPDDIGLVGGKAANFGFLRRSVPDHAPDPAIALTFDLWNEFMAQPYGNGTLAESIAADLGGFSYPPDVPRLRPVLEAIRSRIREAADFDAPERSAIIAALDGFDDDRKIRFRSSTNVEDSTVFSGAGLYDSSSGCLADDTDGDEAGPSHCDPGAAKERGVFRAIRKVYASFYNENAFIERLRHRIDESQVGMAVLVHHSFPDAIELANGVATLEIGKPADGPRIVTAQLVSQTGASSITNPNDGFLPEIVQAGYHDLPTGAEPSIKQHSDLLGEGESVLDGTAEYLELLELLDTAGRAYESWFAAEQILELDFEWKKVAPGTLVIKQIRRIPRVPSVPPPVID